MNDNITNDTTLAPGDCVETELGFGVIETELVNRPGSFLVRLDRDTMNEAGKRRFSGLYPRNVFPEHQLVKASRKDCLKSTKKNGRKK